MLYLADRTPKQTLLPSEARARADVTRWMFWTSHHWAPAVGVVNFERLIKKFRGLEQDAKEIARGEALVKDFASVLEASLEGKKFLAHERLTLADILVATPLISLESAELPIMRGTDHPNMRAWFSRIRELPSWRAAAG